MVVEVTADDIKNGWEWAGVRMLAKYGKMAPSYIPKQLANCPVSIALSRTTGERSMAEYYRLTVSNRVYRTPEIVSDWIYDFDMARIEVQPFSFELKEEDEIK